MKQKGKETNFTGPAMKSTQPTIWALRKNVRAHQDNNAPASGDTLYEHLFGYDPIRLLGGKSAAPALDATPVSADNPNLNIIHSQTNFLVMEMASEDPSNA